MSLRTQAQIEAISKSSIEFKAKYAQTFPDEDKNYRFAALQHKVTLKHDDFGEFMVKVLPPMLRA